MEILIIDQCSGSKSFPNHVDELTIEEVDAYRSGDLDNNDIPTIPARDLYAGRQQTYVREAMDTIRKTGHNVTRYFISAGFGLISEHEPIPPYEVTFSSMKASEIDERSEALGISTDLCGTLTEAHYDVVFVAVGSDYARSAKLESTVECLQPNSNAVLFNSEQIADSHENIISISARTNDAKEHGTIVVALKGVYIRNFAQNLANNAQITEIGDIHRLCTAPESGNVSQSGFEDFS